MFMPGRTENHFLHLHSIDSIDSIHLNMPKKLTGESSAAQLAKKEVTAMEIESGAASPATPIPVQAHRILTLP